jgi:serine O-acetyltransferase
VLVPSVRATALIRMATSGGKLRYWLARNLLISLHSIDVGRGAEIGPGLTLPHPFGIVIGKGARVGENVTIYHSVTLGANKGAYPILEDNCTIYPGAVIVGNSRLGRSCTIGANAFISRNVASDEVAF